MGWFDGNPASLWKHPPRGRGPAVRRLPRRRRCGRGQGPAVRRRRRPAVRRRAAQPRCIRRPGHEEAKQLLAAIYDKLGYGAENGTWRNFYLMGALELRHGAIPPSLSLASPDMIQALTVEQLFDSIAIRVNGPKAWSQTLTIDWDFTDESSRHRTTLVQRGPDPLGRSRAGRRRPHADPHQAAAAGHARGPRPGRHPDRGDLGALQRLLGLLDTPDPGFRSSPRDRGAPDGCPKGGATSGVPLPGPLADIRLDAPGPQRARACFGQQLLRSEITAIQRRPSTEARASHRGAPARTRPATRESTRGFNPKLRRLARFIPLTWDFMVWPGWLVST